MPGQSLVAMWDELMLNAIRTGGASPTISTHQLHQVTAAIYDAWSAYSDDAYGYYSTPIRPTSEHTEANKAEAISYAAHAALTDLFPANIADFDAFMDELGYPLNPSSAANSPSAVGIEAATQVLAARAQDGANAAGGYADTTGYVPVNDAAPNSEFAPGGAMFDPNHWQPLRVPNGTLTDVNGVPLADNADPSTYDDQTALTPQWGGIMPVALESGAQFRPAAPPKWGDFTPYTDGTGAVTTNHQAYLAQTTEVLSISATLTERQKLMAEFWADGPRTEAPPGHWNQLAQGIALREGHGIDEDAQMFFALNVALFDAGIATWEAKYHYDYIRPQSAIRHMYDDQTIEAWAGPNLGTAEIQGQDWRPYQDVTFVTPPFPEFVSGHSAFSMAAANTIAAFVGSDTFYDGTSLGNYDLDDIPGTDLLGQYVATSLTFEDFPADADPVILQWETLTEAAEEAGISRLYGGIHIQDGNLRGLDLGADVAQQALPLWQSLFSYGGDDRIKMSPDTGMALAGPGNDTLLGSNVDDLMRGGADNDMMRGWNGRDRLEGEAGDDFLDGGRLGDILIGGAGDDTLMGGWGADVYVLNPNDPGRDLVRGLYDLDVIVIQEVIDSNSLALTQIDNRVRVDIDGTTVAIVRASTPEDFLLGGNLIITEDTMF